MAEDDEAAVVSGGYHYFHDKVAKGEGAAPVEAPPLLAAEPVPARDPTALPEATIESFSFMDDFEEGVVKVYIALSGDLEGAVSTPEEVEFRPETNWGESSLHVALDGKKHRWVLRAEKLTAEVVPAESKVKVLPKKGKVIVVLKKANRQAPWEQLRANVALPYRRGGGGPPR